VDLNANAFTDTCKPVIDSLCHAESCSLWSVDAKASRELRAREAGRTRYIHIAIDRRLPSLRFTQNPVKR
jgi:hypothetical protein